MEPMSAAASGASRALVSAATKQLGSRSGTKLGSRDERRRVYVRFQEVTITSVTFAQHWRTLARLLYRWLMPKRKSEKLFEAARRLLAEQLQAYMELRLVANPGPLEKADQLLSAVNDLFEVVTVKDEGVYDRAVDAVGEAQRAFVDACRDDLWYLPQWWQVYRWMWWRTKVVNALRRRRLPQGEN